MCRLKLGAAMALAAMTALSGCGGGGGGGNSRAVAPGGDGGGGAVGASTTATSIRLSTGVPQTVIAAAAGATPKSVGGDSTAQSKGDGGTNAGKVASGGLGSASGKITYDISYNGKDLVDTGSLSGGNAALDQTITADASTGVHNPPSSKRTAKTLLFERIAAETTNDVTLKGVQFYRRLSAAETQAIGIRKTGTGTAGDLWVDVYTDYDTAADANGDGTAGDDTDYLGGGVWMFVEDGASADADYEYGAFAFGADPFTGANIRGLAGISKYEGTARGVYANGKDRSEFSANVRLTASFGTSSTDGTISGLLTSLVVGGEARPAGLMDLDSTSLTVGSASFSGSTSMTYGGTAMTGTWGGMFYGDGAAATDHPGSTAGTFGVAGGTESFLGTFFAYKE